MIVDKIKKRENKALINKKANIDIPVGKWVKCEKCKEILYKETVRENYNICPNCGHYFRMHIDRRLELIIDKGTYKRFYKTMARVYSYEVTEEQYEKLKNNIKQIEANKEDYKFNIVGLVAVGFHKKIGKEKSFSCAEFVKYVIEKANIDMNLPTIIKPEDFKNVNGLQEIYSGFFRKYNYSKLDVTRILIENLSRYTKKEGIA